MITIHKQTLHIGKEQVLSMPFESEILKVGVQDGEIRLWYACETNHREEDRKFSVYATGSYLPAEPSTGDDYEVYLDMVQIGDFVWHVFECKKWYGAAKPAVIKSYIVTKA